MVQLRPDVQAPHTGETALVLEDICFSYGTNPILFDVSLHVDEGEALALLGTNGAGKSTLLRVACGLERPASGRVVLFGEDITGMLAERVVRKGLLTVLGGKGVFPELSVSENFVVAGQLLRKDPAQLAARQEAVLATFPRLAERWRSPAGSMSGGEQQQLAVAKALLLDPRLLFIDELSLGLAPVVVEALLEVVSQLRAAGTTLVLVEQSLNVAAAICSRAVFLEKGEVRFTGPTAELLERSDIARAVFFGEASA